MYILERYAKIIARLSFVVLIRRIDSLIAARARLTLAPVKKLPGFASCIYWVEASLGFIETTS